MTGSTPMGVVYCFCILILQTFESFGFPPLVKSLCNCMFITLDDSHFVRLQWVKCSFVFLYKHWNPSDSPLVKSLCNCTFVAFTQDSYFQKSIKSLDFHYNFPDFAGYISKIVRPGRHRPNDDRTITRACKYGGWQSYRLVGFPEPRAAF